MCYFSDRERKVMRSLGIELPDGKGIKSLQKGKSYSSLGILEADTFSGE